MSERRSRPRAGGNSRAEKRSKFQAEPERREGQGKRSGIVPLVVAAVGISLLFGGILMLAGLGRDGGTAAATTGQGGDQARRAAGSFTTVEPVDGLISWPLATFDDGKARFYTLSTGGKEIDFFVLKSSDGIVRAAIDSCDVCYPARKGYRQEGDEMVCNNCGQRFPSVRINEVRGGCNPAPLTRTIEGDNLIIRAADVLGEGGGYF